MKHPFLHKLAAAACVLLLVLTLCPAARAADSPAVSKNKNRNLYHGNASGNYSSPVTSYLYENPSGGLTRVEYLGDQKVIAEDYSSSFQLQSSRTIPFELSVWGGFFAGETWNFLIFGQDNLSESDSVEVLRVVKYDKSWNRLGHYSLYGGNVSMIFRAGSLRCAEYGGSLYIRTAREMYKSSDGLNHQACMTLQVRESDMSRLQFIDSGFGYVSHSFNQFVLVDSDRNLVTLDHGDGYPRAAVIHRFRNKAGPEPLDDSFFYSSDAERALCESNVVEFPGKIGQNSTGATLGALAETRTGYVTAFNWDDADSGFASRKIYLGYTHKSDMKSSWVLVSPEKSVSTPHLAPTSLEGGYLLWNAMDGGSFYPGSTLHFASYAANGSVGAVMTAKDAPLSDCAPILYNGKSVWYTTDESVPTFYTLDGSGVTATKANGSTAALECYLFSDVRSGHWAYSAIKEAVDSGLAGGVGNGLFQPSGDMTAAQFGTFLARAFYDGPAQSSTTPWYQGYMDTMRQHGILNGVSSSAETPISRYDMAQMLYHVMSDKGAAMPGPDKMAAAQSSIKDWASVPENYRAAVSACYAAGLINGMEDGSFSGSGVMNRAQGCTVLSRALAYIPHTPAKSEQTYYSVEEFNAEIFRMANEERAKRGLPALREWQALTRAAEIRAEELSVRTNGTRPDGTEYATALGQVGVTSSDIKWQGENRFWGAFTTPGEVKAVWENNPDLVNRICSSYFTHMGVGFYRTENGQTYCAQVFSDRIESNLTRYRTNVITAVNQLRAERGLPALQESEALCRTAQLIAQGSQKYCGTILEQDLGVEGADMEMSLTYQGTVNTPELVMGSMRQLLKADSPVYDATVTHVGVGFYRTAGGVEYCVQCFARFQ